MTPNTLAVAPPRTRAIWTLFAANAISLTGNQLTALAVPWFVLATTGSVAKTSLTAFFTILPTVLALFFGGVLVDRVGFKRMSILADIASGVTVALVPLLFAAGLLEFPLLLVLVFCGALLDAPGKTARDALVPELAEAAGMPLARASSLIQVVERGSRLLGAPLAGLAIATLGAQNALWLDAATFLVSALLVAAVPRIQVAAQEKQGNYREELVAGLRWLRADRLMLTLLGVVMVTNFLDAAKFSVALPVLAQEVYRSPVALGLLVGLSGGGAVVGALLYAAFGQRLSRRWLFIVTFIALSLAPLAVSLLPPLHVLFVVYFLSGIAAGPINPILSTIWFERIPADMRGRVGGVGTALAFIAMPLGVLLGGLLIERLGLRFTFFATGLCYLLTTLSLLFNPTLREMDTRRG